MKFVHAADLHLDSPMRGLVRYEGAPVERMRAATRRALSNLVDLCLAEGAAFLLLAGDLFDDDWRDYGTGLFFQAQMQRLRPAGIEVFLVRGNHDAASAVTRHLRLPAHVHELGTKRPETLALEAHGVAIHGQGFATRAVTEDLSSAYPPPQHGLFNIGLLHTAVDGREGHAPYAPCTVAGLRAKGYDYWALGHVHAAEVLARDPWIVFPGNLQGRHARETGPKGAMLVTVLDQRVVAVEHRALDAVRWLSCPVAAEAATGAEDALDLAQAALRDLGASAEGRPLAVRVELAVAPAVHRVLCSAAERWTNELRARALDAAGDTVWLERVVLQRAAPRGALDRDARPPAADDDDAIGILQGHARAAGASAEELARLAGELDELKKKLPAEAAEGPDSLRLDDPDTLGRLLAEATALVEGRLGRGFVP